MKPLLLGIDTCFERCSAGLLNMRDGKTLACAEPLIGKGHAERLMDIVAGVLADAGARYGDIGRLAVTTGPGSFTGLRVGISAVRGLSLALGVPAVGISSLEAVAAPFVRTGRTVLSVLDAKRGEVYAALYGPDGRELAPPAALAPERLAEVAESAKLGSLGLAGSGSVIAESILGRHWNSEILSSEAHVDMAHLMRLAAKREPSGPPAPLYLRGADAKPPAASLIARI